VEAGAVHAWLDGRAEEMAALVESLVAIDTENPPGRGLGGCGRLLCDTMRGLGLSPELIELPPGHGLEEPCIVRGSVGDGPQTVYFHGHFDVVPAQTAAHVNVNTPCRSSHISKLGNGSDVAGSR